MENNNNQKFDKEFNERFSDFQFNPDQAFFDRITSKMKNNEFDQSIKNRFDQFTATPSEQVWESVKPNLPLHLGLRIYLQRLSRVAAIALFVMTGFYLFQIQQNKAMIASAETVLPAKEKEIKTAAKIDFVFEVPESVPVEEIEKQKAIKKLRKKKKSKKKGISDYLAFILEEADDFDQLIDHKKIKELLQPVEKLSPDFMSASVLRPLPRYASYEINYQDDIELNISIPLQVVEPHEIEGLLRMYEETQRGEQD